MKIKVNKVTSADLALDLDLAPDLGHVAAQVVQQHLGLVSHLDLHRLPSGLHTRGHVNCVAKQAVPGVRRRYRHSI